MGLGRGGARVRGWGFRGLGSRGGVGGGRGGAMLIH